MNLPTELAKSVTSANRYAKGRDSMFSVLLAAGVWLATEVRRDVEDISRRLAAVETKLETKLAHRE